MARFPMTQLRNPRGQFASAPGVVWRGLEVLSNNINRRGKSLNTSRKLAMEKLAKEMEEYAKENARWNDRTTNARQGLQGYAIHDDAKQISTAYLSHGEDYGVWLELMNAGEFAIITPTIMEFQPRMFSTVIELDSFSSLMGSYGGDFDDEEFDR